ncbi:hypothetical protein MPTK1_3g15290 [Marchantia polymorpha subsp. ruderalis]|uniref:F-box domain-containing protein n=2 Tax=Marchantia polymorpha TaxID=3197 RepID=A0AAF6B116_MARPO|nr:hypothetical protein MARPO_0004s0143 [Marchantia polymorpha]BBN05700.1 hypothetical protein Mp_3g15290 [Marchantia polymorpha subsp. ruderalis]|eukprot:PTQ48881.1 hypothetical protein MARPO_0004s0143 [Marchantia polymorpha]
MDPELWRHLPEELVQRILARLPWWSNMQLRSVSRAWRTLLADCEFLRRSEPPVGGRRPCWICRSRDASYTLRNWSMTRSLPLAGLLSTDPQFRLEAATAGLLLMAHHSQPLGRLSFLVNPLNGTRRDIPPLPLLKDPSLCYSLGMVADRSSRSHKIIVVHSELVNCPGAPAQEEIFVYDSRADRWDMVHCMQRQCDDYRGLRSAVFVNGQLYILTVMNSEDGWIYRLFLVLPSRWDEVPARICIQTLSNVHMFEHGGRLMLVGETKTGGRAAAVRIWRLGPSMTKWHEAFVMPDHLLLQLHVPRRGVRFKVHVEGHFACFRGRVVVVCDMLQGSWASSSFDCFRSVDESEFLLEPRLDVVL